MKQGAYIDTTEPVNPWIILFLNFAMQNMEKEESQGSFQPLNVGIGWVYDNQKTDKRKACQKTY